MSFGTKVGTGIGRTAAYAVHGTIKLGTGLGRFGEDVISGTEIAYATQSELLAAKRKAGIALALKLRDEALAAQSISVAVATA